MGHAIARCLEVPSVRTESGRVSELGVTEFIAGEAVEELDNGYYPLAVVDAELFALQAKGYL